MSRDQHSVPEGWKLAMRVLQSDLYAQLDDAERAECDALVKSNPYAPQAEAAGGISAERIAELVRQSKHIPDSLLTSELHTLTVLQIAWIAGKLNSPEQQAAPATAAHAGDPFNGDDAHLVRCIEALLDLDAKGVLVPHGVGGHARTMLKAAAIRLIAPTPVADSVDEPVTFDVSIATYNESHQTSYIVRVRRSDIKQKDAFDETGIMNVFQHTNREYAEIERRVWESFLCGRHPVRSIDLIAKGIAAAPVSVDGLTAAARDVLAERERNVTVEGWTPEHDDEHVFGEMAAAAACYAMTGVPETTFFAGKTVPPYWRWDFDWWKPTTPRRDLEKAGALILAEMERIDRAATTNGAKNDN